MRTLGPDYRAAICLLLLAMLVPPAYGESAAARTPISAAQVAKALEAAGWNVSTAQVKFLTQVRSEGTDPDLQVVQVSRWLKDSAKAKLRCRNRHVCLPFYVVVEGMKDTHSDGAEVAETQLTLDTVVRPPLMRQGDTAKLMFADKALRITIPVICLQSGHRGQTIRVTSSDRRRFYKGEIIGPGLLRATTL
jgi:hypothetical protein